MAAAQGRNPPAGLLNAKVDNGKKKVASVLLTPVAVTKENIADTVIKDGFYKPSEICSAKYKAACAKAGVE